MNDDRIEDQVSESPTRPNRWLLFVVFLLCVTGFCLVYLLRERRFARQLDDRNTELSASLNQTRSQLEALTTKLNSMSAPPPAEQAPSPARPSEKAVVHRAKPRASKRPRVVEDPRWKQVKAELADQQKQIASNQEKLENTRAELEANLNTTRSELGSSIARNHEELVALEKRGERNYFEFDLARSKQFKRVGSISLSLRRTSAKKAYYDVVVLMDDFQLTKKHVDLYEPVLFYRSDSKQPVQLIVNQIGKNQVHGYVSEPKYKPSELTENAPSGTESSSPSKSEATAGLARRPEPQQ